MLENQCYGIFRWKEFLAQLEQTIVQQWDIYLNAAL
jgi:hypothetical protein